MLQTWGVPELRSETAGRLALAGAEVAPELLANQQNVRWLLAAFEPITLAQMASAALLDRSELKFLLPDNLLIPVLAELREAYRLLVVNGQPLSRYRTLYFDTDDMALYHRHHAGASDRYKVRAREYVESRAAFLEVKHKTGARHTVKSRIPTGEILAYFTPQTADFLAEACPYSADSLGASLWNHYTRITLVSKLHAERVTLDLGLAFVRDTLQAAMPGIVVAEVKYQGVRQASEFIRLMRTHRVRETGFSKYCMGVSFLYPDVKHNKFKAKQRQLARLTRGVSHGLH